MNAKAPAVDKFVCPYPRCGYEHPFRRRVLNHFREIHNVTLADKLFNGSRWSSSKEAILMNSLRHRNWITPHDIRNGVPFTTVIRLHLSNWNLMDLTASRQKAKDFRCAQCTAQFTEKEALQLHFNTRHFTTVICPFPGCDHYDPIRTNIEQRHLKTRHNVHLPRKVEGTSREQTAAALLGVDGEWLFTDQGRA